MFSPLPPLPPVTPLLHSEIPDAGKGVSSDDLLLQISVFLRFTSRYWVHWDAKPKRSGRDIRFYVPVKKDGT